MEELMLQMADAPTKEGIENLLGQLKEADLSKSDTADNLALLVESWDDKIEDDQAMADFCVKLGELSPPDTPMMRSALTQAIRHFLPKAYKKRGFLTVLGFRDTAVSLPEIVKRYKKLAILQEETYLYQIESRNWGTVGEIDRFSLSLMFKPVSGKSSLNVPLQDALTSLLFFENSDSLKALVKATKQNVPSPDQCKSALVESSSIELTDGELRDIVFYTLVPAVFNAAAFDEWWVGSEGDSGEEQVRRVAETRSLHELHITIGQMPLDGSVELEADDKAKAFEIMKNLKADLSGADKAQVLEICSLLSPAMTDEENQALFNIVNGQCNLWPDSSTDDLFEALEPWSKIKTKYIGPVARATIAFIGDVEAAKMACRMTQRWINEFLAQAEKAMTAHLAEMQAFLPDALCFIWKNRNSLANDITVKLSAANVTKALGINELPSCLQAGQRELKRLLLENAEFQKKLLDNAGEDLKNVVMSLHTASYFSVSEQQSLMVKLSRNSAKLRELLESGGAEKIFAANKGELKDDDNSPTVTSVFSYNQRLKQLDDIINRQMPENTAAIAHARSYGDLRENAEYKAAKEEEGRLLKRRAQLEADILSAQPTDYKHLEVQDVATVGSSVQLDINGQDKLYHLVGAWDGDPDRDLISYKTKLGQIMLHKTSGDTIELPNVGNAEIKAIQALPAELLEEFAREE